MLCGFWQATQAVRPPRYRAMAGLPPPYEAPNDNDFREFAAMLCVDGDRVYPWLCEVTDSRGDIVWLGHCGEVKVRWMWENGATNRFDFLCVDADDDRWWPAREFIQTVRMKELAGGLWSLVPGDRASLLQACNLASKSKEDYQKWLGVPQQVGTTGAAAPTATTMLSRMLRDAVHKQLFNKVKVGVAFVSNVSKALVLQLLRAPRFGRFRQRQAANSNSIVWVVSSKALLDDVMGGAGWDSVFTKGDTGFNSIITSEMAGARVRKMPVRITFCEAKHREFGLRGYGRLRVSFKWRRNPDLVRRLKHH